MRSVISVPMTDGSSVDRFLATVPSFAHFGQILDPQLCAALPDDWVVGLADVVSSTQAIEAGHYKNVNMAGAAVIVAVSNALGNVPYPFVFGGDGASFALPSDRARQRARRLPAPQPLSSRSMASSCASPRCRSRPSGLPALTFGSPALPPLPTSTTRCFLAAASPGPRRG
jgi:hypothetical protein